MKIIKVGYDIVNRKNFAYGENFQFEITESDRINWNFDLLNGVELEITREDFDALTCEKYEY